CSAWASVLQTMNSQPIRFDRIMLLTAFPPAPPIPMTVMRGLSSCSSFGMLRLIILSPSAPADSFRPQAGPPDCDRVPCEAETILATLLQSRYLPRDKNATAFTDFRAAIGRRGRKFLRPGAVPDAAIRRAQTSRTAIGPPRRRRPGRASIRRAP